MKAFLLLLVCLIAIATSRAEPDARRNADFEWFGTLGFPDVKDLPFVKIAYGWTSYADGRREDNWSNGFLLEETPENLRFLSLQLASYDYPKPKEPGEMHARLEPADLRVFAEAELAPLNPKDAPFGRRGFLRGPHFTERTNRFVLAWMCWRAGHEDLAARLYASAQTAAGLDLGGTLEAAAHEKGWPFRFQLERDLGHFEMWRTIVAFGNPRITRRELLARLQAIPRHFPHCDQLARAEALARQLETMIIEDDAHPALGAAQIGALPPVDQAKELVFRLRDQNGIQMSQPGAVDIFGLLDFGKDSPAHNLVRLGEAAVPALLEALADARPTRSVGYVRDFRFSHHILSVGDAALKIIERIADRQFYASGSIQGTMAGDGETEAVEAAVRAWWDKRQSQGALAELSQTTAAGGFSAARAGAKLLATYPTDAATPILAGAAAVTQEDERCKFIRLVGQLKDERATAFLIREAREGPQLSPRTEAGWQLAKTGRFEGIASLAQQWSDSTPPPMESRAASGRLKLIAVLALAECPEGLRALGEGLRQRSGAARSKVLEVISEGWLSYGRRFGEYVSKEEAARPLPAPVALAMEELLVAELDDTGIFYGAPGFRRGKRFDVFRLCDKAAELLAARWPERYSFKADASYPLRERQRIACLNVWRHAHGQPALPLAPVRPPGDAATVAEVAFADGEIKGPEPLLAALRDARGRAIDAALLLKIERAFLDACGGRAPAADRGFVVDVFRENGTEGITMIAAPAERRAIAKPTEREWRLEYRADFGERDILTTFQADIFGKTPVHDFPGRFEEIVRRIAALSPSSPFHLRLELAPDRWEGDHAY